MTNTLPEVYISNVVRFHGISLFVCSHDNTDFVPLKPIAEALGLTWRSAKTTAIESDNVILYGTTELKVADNVDEGHNIVTLKQTLFIRFDAVAMYLARASTSRMRAKGKVEAADRLLTLQKEWADVLHRYEQGEIISKRQRADSRKDFIQLVRLRNSQGTTKHRRVIDKMIGDLCVELGYQPPENIPHPLDPPKDDFGMER